MRFAVLASPDSWYLRDLQRAAGDRHEVTPLAFDRIVSIVDRSHVEISTEADSWTPFDGVLVRTMPPGSLEQVVFRMDALAIYQSLGGVVVNSPKAVEAAVDKYLTSARLRAAGLDTPRTIVCQNADDALDAFETLGGDVVLKPLFGSEGRGITRLNDPDLALRAFKMLTQLGAVLYLQPFVPHDGYDLRLLVIGDDVFGMRRRNPLDWRTNISRGARGEAFEPGADMVCLAKRAAAAVGAEIAGVDFLPARDGRLYALEVNAVPGWKAIAAATGIDIAERVWQYVESQVVARRGTRRGA